LAISRRTLAEKITAQDLTSLYRSNSPLPEETFARLEFACRELEIFRDSYKTYGKLNKASVFTWLIFIVRANWRQRGALPSSFLAQFREYFETMRFKRREAVQENHRDEYFIWLAYIFEDRSSARVADTSSVVLRDAILWFFYRQFASQMNYPLPLTSSKANALNEIFDASGSLEEDELSHRLLSARWGDLP
jgi:hypothetical protein